MVKINLHCLSDFKVKSEGQIILFVHQSVSGIIWSFPWNISLIYCWIFANFKVYIPLQMIPLAAAFCSYTFYSNFKIYLEYEYENCLHWNDKTGSCLHSTEYLWKSLKCLCQTMGAMWRRPALKLESFTGSSLSYILDRFPF